MPNGIFVAENMASTKLSSLLKTARYVAGNPLVPTAIQNGRVVVLGALEANQREVHVAADVAAATDPIHVVDNPEVIYSEEITRGLNDYINPAGITIRVRQLQVGDQFAVSGNAITALGLVPVVGNFIVTPAAGNLWTEIAAPVGNESVACQIVDSYVLGADMLGGRNITMYGVKVITA